MALTFYILCSHRQDNGPHSWLQPTYDSQQEMHMWIYMYISFLYLFSSNLWIVEDNLKQPLLSQKLFWSQVAASSNPCQNLHRILQFHSRSCRQEYTCYSDSYLTVSFTYHIRKENTERNYEVEIRRRDGRHTVWAIAQKWKINIWWNSLI